MLPRAPVIKNLPANAGDIRRQIRSLHWEDHLEEGMATHSSILTWSVPWTEEPGGLHTFDRVTTIQTQLKQLSTLTHVIWVMFLAMYITDFYFGDEVI